MSCLKFFAELPYLKEWVWNLETKLCSIVSGNWNVGRIASKDCSMLGIECCRIIMLIVNKWPNG